MGAGRIPLAALTTVVVLVVLLLLTALEKRAKKLKLPFFKISGVTREGTKELIEAAWPIIAKAREAERAAIDLAKQEEELSAVAPRAKADERVVPADYNPALVEPVRKSKPKKHR